MEISEILEGLMHKLPWRLSFDVYLSVYTLLPCIIIRRFFWMLLENSHPDTSYSSKVDWIFNTTFEELASFSIDVEIDNFLFFSNVHLFKGYFCFDYLDSFFIVHFIVKHFWANLTNSFYRTNWAMVLESIFSKS